MMSTPLSPAPPGSPSDAEYLLIHAGDEVYALSGAFVREVIRWREPTPVPGAPATLPGIISQRGVVLAVVDLRVLLGLPTAAPGRSTRLIILQHEQADLALLVDAVIDLGRLAVELEPPPVGLEPRRARMLSAVTRHGNQPLAVIDLAALIAVVQEGT